MDVEWLGVTNCKCNYEIPLLFAHVVLTRTLSIRKAREILARINRRLDLWEIGIHARLVGDVFTEVRSREVFVEQHDIEEGGCLARRFRSTLLSVNLRHAFSRATNREGGVSPPRDF